MQGFDLYYFGKVVRRRFVFFIIPFLVVLGIGGVAIYFLPVLYNSSALLLVESQRIPDNFVKATETEVAALRLELLKQRVTSRDNLLELIDKYSLYAKERNLSRSDKVDLMRDRVEFSLVDIGLDITTMNGKGGEAKKVNGPRDRFATAFSVGFKSENPNIAAQVANSLVTLVLQEDVQHRSAAASETTKFLTKEADRAASELAKADSAIADFKDTNSAKLPEKLQYSTTQLDRQLREIEDLKRTISAGPDQKRLIEIKPWQSTPMKHAMRRAI